MICHLRGRKERALCSPGSGRWSRRHERLEVLSDLQRVEEHDHVVRKIGLAAKLRDIDPSSGLVDGEIEGVVQPCRENIISDHLAACVQFYANNTVGLGKLRDQEVALQRTSKGIGIVFVGSVGRTFLTKIEDKPAVARVGSTPAG